MTDKIYNVLFLCTHNSARSVIAECILNSVGRGRFNAYSAGSMPRGEIHPSAMAMLNKLNYDTSQLRSKSWHEFAQAGAPEMDFVFTVCDSAVNEVCPAWPGQPMSANWAIPDPSVTVGREAERHYAFAETHRMMHQRISIFTSLPLASLDKLTLQKRLDDIGQTSTQPTQQKAG